MKILFLHNQYLVGGGEDVSTQMEIDLLKEQGHDVDQLLVFNEDLVKKTSVGMAIDAIWSRHFYKNLEHRILVNKYDIIHVQNFFPQISPSVFYAARRNGTKILMSLRNYRLICPNAKLYVKNQICTKCVGKTIPFPALQHNCYRDSFGATSVTVAMLSIHNLFKTWSTKIDGFIAISDFVKQQFKAGGFDGEKIFVRYNFVKDFPEPLQSHQDHFLYAGRLSEEKGIEILLAAFNSPELQHEKLRIIGNGPLLYKVKEAILHNQNITYLGTLPLQETYQQMALAKCLLFPSQWHEPFGRTIIESFAMHTPVIGTDRGAVPELILDNYNGFIFKAEDRTDFVSVIKKFNILNGSINYGENAWNSFVEKYTPESSYSGIMAIYNKVLDKEIYSGI